MRWVDWSTWLVGGRTDLSIWEVGHRGRADLSSSLCVTLTPADLTYTHILGYMAYSIGLLARVYMHNDQKKILMIFMC